MRAGTHPRPSTLHPRVRRSYLNKVMEIALPTYVPSVEDVLKTRVRTSGIIEESYDIDGVRERS